jgi:hypothetical protein
MVLILLAAGPAVERQFAVRRGNLQQMAYNQRGSVRGE